MDSILAIISCHTDSDIKIKALIHNMKYFMEISDTIYIINSLEFNILNIEEKIKNIYFNKNIIFNDELTDELCYIYKTKYNDIKNYTNDQLREHWLNCGKAEKRTFSFPVYNIYFDYKENNKYSAHGKWLHILNKINYSSYENIILTNDSIIISRSLLDFKKLIDPNTELVSLLESYQTKHHYPDFLRAYNSVGIRKLIAYFMINMNRITDLTSLINIFEIESSYIFDTLKVLYTNIENYKGNIHFDNDKLEDYIFNKNYPVVKIKKILFNFYPDDKIPSDFNSSEYKMLNPDLTRLSDIGAIYHFKNHGISEGRLYKKNQKSEMPLFLKHYMNLIGFKI